MAIDPQLERYLTALDRALGQISVSDRSDIITEIKSHVLEAEARDPQSNLKTVLDSLGEPENVANRYLIERGIKPGRPSISPVVKWLTIGFLGTFGILAVLFVTVLWRFTPVLKVNEDSGQVVILGGLIEINGASVEGSTSRNKSASADHSFDGDSQVDATKISTIKIDFTNGQFDISPSSDSKLHWSCTTKGGKPTASEENQSRAFVFNFKSTEVDCDIEVPQGIALMLEGSNGEVNLDRPQAQTAVKLDNGQIDVTPDETKQYKYEASVVNGSSQGAVSSSAPDAIPLKLAVTNGNIEVE